MTLPTTACPITYTCAREYLDTFTTNIAIGILDPDGMQEVLGDARVSNPTKETVFLRGFFVAELVYSDLLPKQCTASGFPEVTKEVKSMDIPRTEKGVLDLREHVEAWRRKVTSRCAIATIKKDFHRGQMQSALASTFEYLVQLCETLSGCLRRNDTKNIYTMGCEFAKVLAATNATHMDVELILRALLTVSTSNPIHAWEREA